VNLHHVAEAAFKALGLATRDALTLVGRGVPSTKGVL
jgi:imidazoleglycerol phosphate dehydratase HisB